MAVRLSAIVVAFGKPALLDECLAAIEDALARVGGESELIVVANDGSEPSSGLAPGARRRPRRAGARVRGRRQRRARGCPGRVDRARERRLPRRAERSRRAARCRRDGRARRVGRSAGALRGDGGLVNSAGLEVDELGVARERGLGQPALRPRCTGQRVPVEVFGASAACALYRRAMLDDLGGFDRSFFAYLEDADLAWRARMAGWRCLLAPAAVARHHHSATLGHGSASKHRLVGRNRVRMLAKNASAAQLRRGLLRIVAYDLAYAGYVAATARTLAPLTGRLRGLTEWRAYREAGRPARRDLALPRAPGLHAALVRNRVYTMRALSPGAGR